MKQCNATKKDGARCKNAIPNSEDYCHVHKRDDTSAVPALAIGGAIIGNILVPGIGGAIVGGIIGGFLGAKSKAEGNDNE